MKRKVKTGLNFGMDDLTNEIAYILGGIIVANETVRFQGHEFMLSPVRHNLHHVTNDELKEHYTLVKNITNGLPVAVLFDFELESKEIFVKKFRANNIGFATLVQVTESIDIRKLAKDVTREVMLSSDEVKKSFIAGAFDGRGSLDIDADRAVIRQLALDCNDSVVAYYVNEVVVNYGIQTNYNRSRDRLEGGQPRDNQFRITNINTFMEEIGFVSPRKFANAITCFNMGMYEKKLVKKVLPGLKVIG